MTINLDGLNGAASQTGRPGTPQAQAQARQQQWMYQLEQALLSGNVRRPEQRPDSSATDARQTADEVIASPIAGSRARAAAAPLPVAVAAPAAHAVARMPADGAPVREGFEPGTLPRSLTSSRSGDASAGVSGPGVTAATAHADPVTAAVTSAHPDIQDARAQVLPPDEESAVLRGLVAAPGSGMPALAAAPPLGGGNMGLQGLAYGSGVCLPPLAALPLAGATAAASGVQTAVQDRLQAVLHTTAAAVSMGMAAPPAQARLDGAPSAMDDVLVAHDAQHPAAPPVEGDGYASRLLHVYLDAEGVQAWLRDAAVDVGNSAALAQAIASELAGAGNRLTALTVNGRRLALPAHGVPASAAAVTQRQAAWNINENGAA